MKSSLIQSALFRVLLVLSVLLAAGCGKDEHESPHEELQITPHALSMKQGTSQQYRAVLINADGSKQDVTREVTWQVGPEAP